MLAVLFLKLLEPTRSQGLDLAAGQQARAVVRKAQLPRREGGGALDVYKRQLHYLMPLNEIIYDFFDTLKARTKGYACLLYTSRCV